VVQPALARVDLASRRLSEAMADAEAARREWIEAMKDARRQGASLRAIAKVAGVSWERVRQLTEEFPQGA
jgi:transposase-like protein